MRTYNAGETVKKGYYLNRKSFAMLTVEQDGLLEGAAGSRYVRIPWPMLLMLAPAVGAGFVFFLPAIAFVMVLYYLSKAVYKLAVRGVGALVPAPAAAVADRQAGKDRSE